MTENTNSINTGEPVNLNDDMSDGVNDYDSSTNDSNTNDSILEILDELINESEEELPEVNLGNSTNTSETNNADVEVNTDVNTETDTDVDLSFINEKNHYSMHNRIAKLIRDGKLKMSNANLLFDALNQYYDNFCEKLDSSITNTKYYGFKMPTSKPAVIKNVTLNNYVEKYYSTEESESIKEYINNLILNDVFKINDGRIFQNYYNNIILVRS